MSCSYLKCKNPKQELPADPFSKYLKLPFVCPYCREKRYCSEECRYQDYNLAHNPACQERQKATIASTEVTSPFIKEGILLSEEEVKKIATLKKLRLKTQIAEQKFAEGGVIELLYERVDAGKKRLHVLGKGTYGEVLHLFFYICIFQSI